MTTVLIPNELSYYFSSNPNNGALNVSLDGSSFSVDMQSDPIKIPKNSVGSTISLETASIWNDVYNITSSNNQITINATALSVNPKTFTIPVGSYSIGDLNAEINRQITNDNNTLVNIFEMTPNFATGKVVITKLQASFNAVDFSTNTQTQNLATFLGWAPILQAFTLIGESYTGANVANVNNIDFFLIHTDLVQNGVSVNGAFNNIIGQVLITEAPGVLINYEPTNPTKIDCQNLESVIGRRNIRFWITNQDNNAITMPSYWNFSIKINYYTPMIS